MIKVLFLMSFIGAAAAFLTVGPVIKLVLLATVVGGAVISAPIIKIGRTFHMRGFY